MLYHPEEDHLVTRAPYGSLPAEQQLEWAVQQELRLQRFGPKAILIPIGNPQHEAADFTTVTAMGALTQWGTAPIGTYAPGARTLWGNPLTYEGPGFVPVLGPFNGSDEWIEFPDDVIWDDDIAGGAHEPDYTWVIWAKLVTGTAQTLWSKTPTPAGGGTSWVTYLSNADNPNVRSFDDNVNAIIGQGADSGISAGWHHLAFTKTTGAVAADFLIYVDGAVVASSDVISGSYVQQEDTSTVVRIGAESDGGVPLISSVGGASCAPVFVPGVVASADLILEDFQSTRLLLGV